MFFYCFFCYTVKIHVHGFLTGIHMLPSRGYSMVSITHAFGHMLYMVTYWHGTLVKERMKLRVVQFKNCVSTGSCGYGRRGRRIRFWERSEHRCGTAGRSAVLHACKRKKKLPPGKLQNCALKLLAQPNRSHQNHAMSTADSLPSLASRALHERKWVRVSSPVWQETNAHLSVFCEIQWVQGTGLSFQALPWRRERLQHVRFMEFSTEMSTSWSFLSLPLSGSSLDFVSMENYADIDMLH